MMKPPPIAPRQGSPEAAFTLLEVVFVIAIVAALAAVTIPSWRNAQEGAKARRPLVELVKLAQEARARALSEGRPYQVIFEEGGFVATRYFDPYAEEFDIEEFFAELERADLTRQANGPSAIPDDEDGPPARPELALRYELPEGATYEVQRWGEPEPITLGDGRIHSWVFQPSGLCNPIRVRIVEDEAYHEAVFNSLTADIDHEAYYVP